MKLTQGKKFVIISALLAVVSLSGCAFYEQLKARNELNHGVAAYTSQRYDEAIESFKKAIELDPTLVDAYLYLAATYRAQFVPLVQNPENLRKGRQAITSFEEVLEMDPENDTAIKNIADLYRNMNQPEEAKDWYRKLMEVEEDPQTQAEARYGIAAINYNVANDQTGLDGQNVENLDEETLAEVNRIVEQGIESLDQALEIKPDYTEAMEYLNLLYREKAELAQDEEEQRRWEREADRLALRALELKREQQRELERQRREVFAGGEEESE